MASIEHSLEATEEWVKKWDQVRTVLEMYGSGSGSCTMTVVDELMSGSGSGHDDSGSGSGAEEDAVVEDYHRSRGLNREARVESAGVFSDEGSSCESEEEEIIDWLGERYGSSENTVVA